MTTVNEQAELVTRLQQLLRKARDDKDRRALTVAVSLMSSDDYRQLSEWVRDDLRDMYAKAYASVTGGMVSMIDHGPAVVRRCTEKGYPFGDRYPIRVKVLRAVTSDFPWLKGSETMFADSGKEYPAWTNSYGAVSAILNDGRKLGLYPSEFEVTEWSGGS